MVNRALYLDYVVKAHRVRIGRRSSVAVAKRDALRRWAKKTKDQRIEWSHCLDELRQSQAHLEESDTVAGDANAWESDALTYENIALASQWNLPREDRETDFWQEYIYAASEAARTWGILKTLYTNIALNTRIVEGLAVGEDEHPDVGNFATAQRENHESLRDEYEANETRWLALAQRPPFPERPDGRRKMLKTWAHLFDNFGAKRFGRRQNALKNAGNDVNAPTNHDQEKWVGPNKIMAGGQSQSSLFVRLDEENNIADRVIRKDVLLDEKRLFLATDWDGDIRDRTNCRPYEIACHDDLSKIKWPHIDRRNVPEVRHVFMDDELSLYRIYMEYCPFGDLGDLIHHYRYNVDDVLPEPAFWCIFHSLAKAVWAMQQGNSAHGEEPNDDWKEIIHCDLKPNNVLLGIPTTGHFDMYPSVKVTDFGLSFRTWDDDRLNPNAFLNQGGTRGFVAPELRNYVDQDSEDPIDRFQITAKANIWGIGMIMLSLLLMDNRPPTIFFLGNGTNDEVNVAAEIATSRWDPRVSNDLVELSTAAAKPMETAG